MRDLPQVKIDVRDKTVSEVQKEMVDQMYEHGFHSDGMVVFGDWEVFASKRIPDGLESLIWVFKDKFIFIFVIILAFGLYVYLNRQTAQQKIEQAIKQANYIVRKNPIACN